MPRIPLEEKGRILRAPVRRARRLLSRARFVVPAFTTVTLTPVFPATTEQADEFGYCLFRCEIVQPPSFNVPPEPAVKLMAEFEASDFHAIEAFRASTTWSLLDLSASMAWAFAVPPARWRLDYVNFRAAPNTQTLSFTLDLFQSTGYSTPDQA